MGKRTETLRSAFGAKPILFVDPDADRVFLADSPAATRLLIGSDTAAMTAMNIAKAFAGFMRLVGDESRVFVMAEMPAITGMPFGTLDRWVRSGIIVPTSIIPRGTQEESWQFDVADAFVAGAAASLRRAGVSLPLIEKAGDLLRAVADGQGEHASAAATEQHA